MIKFGEEITKLNKNIDYYKIQKNEQEKKEKENQQEIVKFNLENNELTKEIKEKEMTLKLDDLKQIILEFKVRWHKKKWENELKIYNNKIND